MALFYPHYHLFYSLVIPLVSTIPMAGQQAAFPQSRFSSPSCSHGHDGHDGHGSKQLCEHGQHDVAWTGPWKFDRMGVVDGCLYMDGWINVPIYPTMMYVFLLTNILQTNAKCKRRIFGILYCETERLESGNR